MLSAAAMKSAAAVASFLLGGASALAPSILSVGETLYDSLPKGVFLGGAPLNVAVHAAQLGAHSIYASAVGDDVLGADARRRLEEAGVDTTLIQTQIACWSVMQVARAQTITLATMGRTPTTYVNIHA